MLGTLRRVAAASLQAAYDAGSRIIIKTGSPFNIDADAAAIGNLQEWMVGGTRKAYMTVSGVLSVSRVYLSTVWHLRKHSSIDGLTVKRSATEVATFVLPAADGETGLFLVEQSGGVQTVRRVQWKDGGSIGTGDKVLVLV